jgi:hypothetical protein
MVLFIFALFPLSPTARAADEVIVSVNENLNGCQEYIWDVYDAGADFTLDIAAMRMQFPNFTHIRIRADPVNLQHAIGRVTITNLPSADPEILILIADCVDVPNFPATPDNFFFINSLPMCSNWGGLAIGSNADVSKITLAAKVGGNITGTVTVGRVFSVVANGSINADVTSTNTDSLSDPSDDSIGFLSASNAILGSISATNGSINTIRCGVNNASSGGIDGDIKAENGLIQDILSTGPIGANRPSNNKVKIRAGYGIIQTTCRYVNAQGVVQPRNMTAEVRADVQADLTPEDYVRDEQHGKIEKFNVSGDYSGEIKAWTVRPLTYTGGDPNGDHGIFISGAMTGPITIERNVLTASIIAGSFSQPIIVGEELKGQIVATEGPIHSIVVGRDPAYSIEGFRGITGSIAGMSWAPYCTNNTTEPPALIRSPVSIGLIDTPAIDLINKYTGCRIESPIIGELRVDSLVFAIVWSGVNQTTGPVASDPTAYADIGIIDIGNMYCGHGTAEDACFGPTAIYVDQFTSCTIASLMGGAIYTPDLPQDKTIWIGCQLDWDLSGGPGGISGVQVPNPSNTQTCGQIIVHEALGLQGQVIINGSNDYPACVPATQDPVRAEWTGLVKITEDPDDIRLYPGAPDPDEAPFYLRPASQLGGYWDSPANNYSRGAVGVAPFALHYASCSPPNDPLNPANNPPQIMQTAFQHSLVDQSEWIDVILDFYGPIVASSSGAPLIQAFHLVNGNTIDITPYIVAEIVDEPLAPFSRKLRLYGAGNYRFTVGVIRIEPILIDTNQPGLGFTLRSDGVNGLPSVRDFAYHFELLHDCNNDNIEDPIDPLPANCVLEGYCPADFNLDGFVDYFDYTDYVDCFETGFCPPHNDADVNGDGFVDYFDYDMYVGIFENGC